MKIDDTNARSVQKTPAGVLVVRRGLFFVKRQRRCVGYFQKSREVLNMLVAEYDYDTDIAIQRKESLMLGIQQGFSDGIRQTAKLMKQSACDIDFIVKITGLSQLEIEAL